PQPPLRAPLGRLRSRPAVERAVPGVRDRRPDGRVQARRADSGSRARSAASARCADAGNDEQGARLMLLTVRETAERLRVSARTVEREIAAGRLACVRVRSRRRVDEADLAAYISQSRRAECLSGSTADAGRCASASEVVAALNALCPSAPAAPTRSRSKLRS